jgi:hypothetical protein
VTDFGGVPLKPQGAGLNTEFVLVSSSLFDHFIPPFVAILGFARAQRQRRQCGEDCRAASCPCTEAARSPRAEQGEAALSGEWSPRAELAPLLLMIRRAAAHEECGSGPVAARRRAASARRRMAGRKLNAEFPGIASAHHLTSSSCCPSCLPRRP